MNNIVLIGMPGAGKSTLGVILAKVFGYQFLDSDLLIQKREGRLLCEIMEECGTKGFLAIEEDVNVSIETDNTVIATGGSVVYEEKAMRHFKEIGTIVYLKLDYQSLQKRLGDMKARGVVLKDGQTLLSLYEERTPLYEKYADIILDEENTLENTVEKLVETLKEIKKNERIY